MIEDALAGPAHARDVVVVCAVIRDRRLSHSAVCAAF